MFARYYVELPLPLAPVEEALLREPQEWVPGLARSAEDFGDRLLAEVGFGSDGRRIAKQIVIEVGEPIRFPSRTVLPTSWRPAVRQSLFPTFDADIEVAALGPRRTQLSVSARYKPPLGAVGRAIDKALLHRVAEAIVKDFVDGVGVKLRSLVSTEPSGRSGDGADSVRA